MLYSLEAAQQRDQKHRTIVSELETELVGLKDSIRVAEGELAKNAPLIAHLSHSNQNMGNRVRHSFAPVLLLVWWPAAVLALLRSHASASTSCLFEQCQLRGSLLVCQSLSLTSSVGKITIRLKGISLYDHVHIQGETVTQE